MAEMGATWIEGGCVANPVFSLAAQEGLLKPPLFRPDASRGLFCTTDGRAIDLPVSITAYHTFKQIEQQAAALFSIGCGKGHGSLLNFMGVRIQQELHNFPEEQRWSTFFFFFYFFLNFLQYFFFAVFLNFLQSFFSFSVFLNFHQSFLFSFSVFSTFLQSFFFFFQSFLIVPSLYLYSIIFHYFSIPLFYYLSLLLFLILLPSLIFPFFFAPLPSRIITYNHLLLFFLFSRRFSFLSLLYYFQPPFLLFILYTLFFYSIKKCYSLPLFYSLHSFLFYSIKIDFHTPFFCDS